MGSRFIWYMEFSISDNFIRSDLMTLKIELEYFWYLDFKLIDIWYWQRNHICQTIFAAPADGKLGDHLHQASWFDCSLLLHEKPKGKYCLLGYKMDSRLSKNMIYIWLYLTTFMNYSPVSFVTVKVTNVKIVLLLHCP